MTECKLWSFHLYIKGKPTPVLELNAGIHGNCALQNHPVAMDGSPSRAENLLKGTFDAWCEEKLHENVSSVPHPVCGFKLHNVVWNWHTGKCQMSATFVRQWINTVHPLQRLMFPNSNIWTRLWYKVFGLALNLYPCSALHTLWTLGKLLFLCPKCFSLSACFYGSQQNCNFLFLSKCRHPTEQVG